MADRYLTTPRDVRPVWVNRNDDPGVSGHQALEGSAAPNRERKRAVSPALLLVITVAETLAPPAEAVDKPGSPTHRWENRWISGPIPFTA